MIVWDKKTKKSVDVEPIDAKEYVESGGWQYDEPKPTRRNRANKTDSKDQET
jgi:hypothetical protein